MEQNETPSLVTTRSTGIRFGLISGVIGVAFFLVLNVSGVNMTKGYWSWIGYCITAVIIFFAHKYYKENTNGFMKYSQGIGISVWMGIISGVISSVFTYIYVKFIDSGFIEMIKEKQMEEMESKGMSEEQMEQAMKIAGYFTTPEAMLLFGLIGGIIGTLIIGLIVTIFTQKKPPETAF
jgi:hypothetical protein